jgi:hypothetical protein
VLNQDPQSNIKSLNFSPQNAKNPMNAFSNSNVQSPNNQGFSMNNNNKSGLR